MSWPDGREDDQDRMKEEAEKAYQARMRGLHPQTWKRIDYLWICGKCDLPHLNPEQHWTHCKEQS